MKLDNSHDKFFKETFSNKSEAVGLLKGALPAELVKKINFRKLRLDKTSYIDEELKEHFSDLVFDSIYNGKTEIKISILIEHKSFVPEYPHIQLLRYLLKIWETNIKQKKQLIPVIPLIVYHGKKSWKIKTFTDYFKGFDETLKAYIPAFDYILLDLTKYSDEKIRELFEAMTVQLSLLLMKKIFDDKELLTNFAKMFSGIDGIVTDERGEKYLFSVFLYIFSNTDIEPEKIIKEIKQISNKGGEIAMTTAVKLEQRGLQQGLQQGKQQGFLEGQKKAVLKLYNRGGFSAKQIADILELDLDFVEKTIKEGLKK